MKANHHWVPTAGLIVAILVVGFIVVRIVSITYLGVHLRQPPPKARVQDIRARMIASEDPYLIQTWAIKKLQAPRTNDFISWEDVPGGLTRSIVISKVERDGPAEYVLLCFQAHGGVYGLAVGPNTWTPSPGVFEYSEEWIPGVHVFFSKY